MEGEVNGECRNQPPTVLFMNSSSSYAELLVTKWPKLHKDEWCGKWSDVAKKEVPFGRDMHQRACIQEFLKVWDDRDEVDVYGSGEKFEHSIQRLRMCLR